MELRQRSGDKGGHRPESVPDVRFKGACTFYYYRRRGSGGALSMAVANQVWMMEHAVYSVLSPEGFASILWKDSKKADQASEVMKMTAEDLVKLQIVDQVIPETVPACEEVLTELAGEMETRILKFLADFGRMTDKELVEQRYERFRRI